MTFIEDCPGCDGDGFIETWDGGSRRCDTCGGDGVIERESEDLDPDDLEDWCAGL